jgi:organic radical activating enzyme
MKNLKLFVNYEDYTTFAGPSWPSYDEYINGVKVGNFEIQQEIDNFTNLMLGEGKKFPIRTKTSCQSKWAWSTIYLNQLSTASCHRVNPVSFSLEEFDDFHNIPKKLNDRKLMLEGKWPTGGCEYCQQIEDSGGWSDRQHNLEIRNLVPPELEYNSTEIRVTPTIVEIFAQNTCNLACTYCNGNLSSKIETENKKFGEFKQDGVIIPVINTKTSAPDEYFQKFLHWLNKNITSLRRLHLLGGETFLQHNLLTEVIKIIQANPNPNLELCIFSNLNVPDKVWDLYINQFKDLQKQKYIKVFDLTASIDCWGKEQEYARSGLNLEKFEERFAWASEQDDWLRLNVNQTVTVLTVKTMPGLIEKVDYYSKHKHIGHYFQYYTGPHMFQHPKVYSYELWHNDFDNIFKSMPTRTVAQLEAIQRMQGMHSLLTQYNFNNLDEIKKLHIYLDELDRRRNTNWRELFGYLNIS